MYIYLYHFTILALFLLMGQVDTKSSSSLSESQHLSFWEHAAVQEQWK